MSKEQAELDKARELVAEVVGQEEEPVPNTISDGSGPLDPRYALWRSFCAEHGVPFETLPGDLADPLREKWEGLKDEEIQPRARQMSLRTSVEPRRIRARDAQPRRRQAERAAR